MLVIFSVPKLLPSSVLYKSMTINMYFFNFLYEFETWLITLKVEHKLQDISTTSSE